MKKADYVIFGTSPTARRITAQSESAKKRTPEPHEFPDKASALAFVKEGAAEGYRFSGRELVDPEYKLVSYGYFVKNDNGQLIPSGQDWGPPDPVFEKGDVMPGGPKNGKHAVVLQVVGGDFAKKAGFGFMIVLEEVTLAAGAN
jgi:hypothetical protein